MRTKKLLSAVLSAAMCLSIVTANVSADNSIFIETSESAIEMVSEKSDDFQSISELGAAYRLEDVAKDLITLNSISSKTNDVAAYSTNSAPVAGLSTMVVNPETLLNGSMTTETVVYWLWYDGETYYSYDPDGDEIVNYYVSGINDYILGTVTLDGEAIGFATQITVAAEYDLLFQVEDSNGNLSSVLNYTFPVEPANGNSRPTASLSAYGQSYVNSEIVFDWSNSSDTDGDKIVDGKIRVYIGDDYEVATEESSQYYVSKTNTSATLKFPSNRKYTLWLSVSDNYNNWSDWLIATISIEKNPIITLSDTEWSDSMTVRTKPTGSNSYVRHTLWSRLGGEICVDGSDVVKYNSYTNHNGTYYNVYRAPIAAGTLFSSAETWTSSDNENVYTDPVFGWDTPRRITQSEIDYLKNNKYNYYIIYTTDLKVIDFYSELNPLVKSGWSQISHT